MGTIEILKNVSAVLLLLTGVCFCYQTVYLAAVSYTHLTLPTNSLV